MSETFEIVVNIISEVCDIPAEEIRRDSHVIKDLNIDSLDLLDVIYEVDSTFNITTPVEDWIEQARSKSSSEDFFRLDIMIENIEKLVAAKTTSSAVETATA
jgi:acyl carrier protein